MCWPDVDHWSALDGLSLRNQNRSPPTPSLARGQSNREKERLNRLNLDATTGAYRRDAT
jgi:hypothetical protein